MHKMPVMSARPSRTHVFTALLLGLTAVHCNTLLGLDQFRECAADCPGAGGGTTSTSSSTGTGGMTSTSSGTAGSGGMMVCVPDTTATCPYQGPAGTEGVGNCVAGTKTCSTDGSGYSACSGEVTPDPAGEACNKLGDEDCDGVACSDPVLLTLLGDQTDQRITSMAVDKDGNIIVAGVFQGTMTIGATTLSSVGSNDYFIAKFTSVGDLSWARRYGDTIDNGSSIHVASDAQGNVFLAAELKGSADFSTCGTLVSAISNKPVIAVAKLNQNGSCQWALRLGDGLGGGQNPSGIATTAQGDLVLSGYYDSSITLGSGAAQKTHTVKNPGYQDLLLARIGADGSYQWSKAFTDQSVPSATSSRAIGAPVIDATGAIYFAGVFAQSVTLDTKTLTAAGSGGAIVLAKFDGSGNAQLAHSYGGQTGFSNAPGLTVAGGRVVVTGSIADPIDFGGGALPLQGQYDGYVAAFDLDLKHQWSFRFGDANDVSGFADSGLAVAADKSGNILLTGVAYGEIRFGTGPTFTAQGMRDIFLVKLDPNGTHLWSKLFGDTTDQIPGGIGVNPTTNHVILAGSTQGTIDFGTGAKPSSGGYDAFLATFQP